MKRPLLIVLCGMLVPISQTSCFPQVAPQTPCEELSDNGDSLRILTLNTALLGDVAQELLGALDPVPYDNDERGCNYANRLLEQDYDIIVLNEVFDENGRDALYNGGCNPDGALAHAYPYVVKKIENGSMEDSGLMLFSRYPFWELRPHDYDDEEIEVYQHGNAVSEPEKYVASIQYEACYDTHVIPLHGILINAGDCNADKAVALVKIFIPHTERRINIVFTHTQASYGDYACLPTAGAREEQFRDIQRLIEDVLGDERLTQDVILLGDLNVDGDQIDLPDYTGFPDLDMGTPCDPDPDAPGEWPINPWEWITRFGDEGNFFHHFLQDCWVYEQSRYGPPHTFDRGLTHGSSRLDYVVRNRPSSPDFQPLAVQHLAIDHTVTRDYNYFEMSDHRALSADLNLAIEHCNPLDALELVSVDDELIPGEIPHPGSMQWYKIEWQRNGFAFGVQEPDFDFEVYQATDMSVPWPSHRKEKYVGKDGLEGEKYLLPYPPYYIRVRPKARCGTGQYHLYVHKMMGRSKEDAEILTPNDARMWYHYTMPPDLINVKDTVWFAIPIEEAFSHEPQHLRFFVTDDNDNLNLSLVDEKDNLLGEATVAEWNYEFDEAGSKLLEISSQELGRNYTTYYLKVKREQLIPTSFYVRWETNLTALHGNMLGVDADGRVVYIPNSEPMKVKCITETDGGVSYNLDEILAAVYADDLLVVGDVYLERFDGDTRRDFPPPPTIPLARFVRSARIELWDIDPPGCENDGFIWHIGPAGRFVSLPIQDGWNVERNEGGHPECCEHGEYWVGWNLSRLVLQSP